MSSDFSVSTATHFDRDQIYRIRHSVYALELGQHHQNPQERLTDALDAVNEYIVVRCEERVVGFVSITPPNRLGYSVDKYLSRNEIPVVFDENLYEVRLLTVVPEYRNSVIAELLIYGAFRYLLSRGAQQVVAIGRSQVLPMYRAIGFELLNKTVSSGAVTFELMAIDKDRFAKAAQRIVSRQEAGRYADLFALPAARKAGVYHGGAFFQAVGERFQTLENIEDVISADVLDAWFDPAPEVVSMVSRYLPWEMRTSPPTHVSGVLEEIAEYRGVPVESLVMGSGSSDLIFRALPLWVNQSSKVLILDPMYGEYAHVLEQVIGCRVDRLALDPRRAFVLQLEKLSEALAERYDWVFLVNPNSPTGQMADPNGLAELIGQHTATRFWVDETYIDYVDSRSSLEPVASRSNNLVICKSLSKAFALSGLRSAYLCGTQDLIEEVRVRTPPWVVSLPAQMATVFSLRNLDYYQARWNQTDELRAVLGDALSQRGIEVISGAANFLLCTLEAMKLPAQTLIQKCREHGLFLRGLTGMRKDLDEYTFRIAVKDRTTIDRMLAILDKVLNDN
jgi:histidinol-phosphate/aromatic aminotransferase/cobyric acid decarboxylase-like protein